MSNELCLKDKLVGQQAAATQDSQELLNQHINKLKQIIVSKSEMNSQLDSQNQELQQEINDYKRTIFNLEADASKLKQQSEDDLNMLRQQLRDKEREYQTDINQVEA